MKKLIVVAMLLVANLASAEMVRNAKVNFYDCTTGNLAYSLKNGMALVTISGKMEVMTSTGSSTTFLEGRPMVGDRKILKKICSGENTSNLLLEVDFDSEFGFIPEIVDVTVDK